MPGLYGFARPRAALAEADATGRAMREEALALTEALRHHPDHHALPPLVDTGYATAIASGVVLRAEGRAGGFWEGPDGLRVWIDGEAFGEDGPLSVAETAERLTRNGAPEILDGTFVAMVHDDHHLRFITDPLGLRFLYVRMTENPAWCGELRGFLSMPGEAPRIDAECARQMLAFGHPLGSTSWFEGVELLGPGEVVSFDLDTLEWTRARYHDFEAEARETSRDGFKETVSDLGRLFRRAVARRAPPGDRVGVTLSGGLDSRALLAALPPAAPAPETLTFGKPGCADAVLAARAAAVRGAPHTVTELGGGDWLRERAAHVSRTDGQVDILDLHGLEALPEIERRMDVCLHGFLGDALLGGSYLDRKEFSFLDQYRHRGRRFILQSLHHSGTRLLYRLPFLDLELNARVLAAPRRWLKNSRAYRAMLLKEFPEYFRDIPWEKTSLPISASPLRVLAFRARRKARALWNRLRGRANPSGPAYADYPDWLREEPAAGYLREMLGPGAEAHRFAPEAETAEALRHHFAGGDASRKLGRLLTLEIWLRFARAGGARFPKEDS